jgi:hypothetical protein
VSDQLSVWGIISHASLPVQFIMVVLLILSLRIVWWPHILLVGGPPPGSRKKIFFFAGRPQKKLRAKVNVFARPRLPNRRSVAANISLSVKKVDFT